MQLLHFVDLALSGALKHAHFADRGSARSFCILPQHLLFITDALKLISRVQLKSFSNAPLNFVWLPSAPQVVPQLQCDTHMTWPQTLLVVQADRQTHGGDCNQARCRFCTTLVASLVDLQLGSGSWQTFLQSSELATFLICACALVTCCLLPVCLSSAWSSLLSVALLQMMFNCGTSCSLTLSLCLAHTQTHRESLSVAPLQQHETNPQHDDKKIEFLQLSN